MPRKRPHWTELGPPWLEVTNQRKGPELISRSSDQQEQSDSQSLARGTGSKSFGPWFCSHQDFKVSRPLSGDALPTLRRGRHHRKFSKPPTRSPLRTGSCGCERKLPEVLRRNLTIPIPGTKFLWYRLAMKHHSKEEHRIEEEETIVTNIAMQVACCKGTDDSTERIGED